MKRPVLIVVALAILIVAAFVTKSLLTPKSTSPDGEFAPFSTSGATDEGEVLSEEPVDPDDPSKGTRKTTRKTVRKLVEPREDTLNRPGPSGEDARARREVNRRPRAEGDQPDADQPMGQLDKEDVRKGIKAVTPLVKVCYEDTLEEFPDAAGKVTIGFRIIGEDDKGRVEMTELADEGTTLFDEKLHECLQKRISEAEFETPSGGAVNVRYPFVFSNDAEE